MAAQLNNLKLLPSKMKLKKKVSRVPNPPVNKTEKPNFLYKILPKTGPFCVFIKKVVNPKKTTIHHYWFKTRKETIRFIESSKSKNVQVFLCQASFEKMGDEWSGRSQDNAAFLRNLFADIDCGKDKPYATQAEGKKALLSFCVKTGLPIPAIVNSGIGLYAQWPLTFEVAAEIWEIEAEKLQRLVRFHEPGLDNDNLITDSARVLRPVGATHRKDPNNPKKVTLLQDCEPFEFEDLVAIIDKALTELPATPMKPKPSPNKSDVKRITTVDHNISSSAIVIAEKCAVMAYVRDTKGNVPEPLWHASIVLMVHCIESPTIIHDWSEGHPNYSSDETDGKIAQCKTPPTTCEYFSGLCPDLCSACEYKHNTKIKSPIALGSNITSVDIPDYVEELNREYFVSRIGGKTAIFRESFDQVLNRYKLVASTFSDFKNFHSNRSVVIATDHKGKQTISPLGKAWTDHELRRQYSDVMLTPEGDIEGVYNLWRGFMVEPVEGSWKLMKKHIEQVICNEDKKVFRYVLRWMARLIQNPSTTGEVALVLKGKKGIGKGMFVNPLCTIFGQHSMSIYNGKHLTGNFNAHLQDCILLFVDEAFWAGDKSGESVLKGLITEPTIPIERKKFDIVSVRNSLHIVIASNNDWVIPASVDERRYCVLNVSDRYIADRKYFTALKHEIDNGGLEAMLHYLQNKDISKFNVRAVPKTIGLTEQKLQSLDTVMTWWYQKLSDGVLLDGYVWGDAVPSDTLYKDFVNSAQQQGVHRRDTATAFGIKLRKVLPKGWPKKSREIAVHEPERINSKRVNHYAFPSLKLCRKKFSEVLGDENLVWES